MRIHRVGDLVRNRENGWYGRVVHVECMACGKDLVRGRCAQHKFAGKCIGGRWCYALTISQLNVPGDLRPWCLPERFPVVGPVWERVLKDPLVRQ